MVIRLVSFTVEGLAIDPGLLFGIAAVVSAVVTPLAGIAIASVRYKHRRLWRAPR